MPHINDLSINNIFEGNNGEKWQIVGNVNGTDELLITLARLKVVEEIIEPIKEI